MKNTFKLLLLALFLSFTGCSTVENQTAANNSNAYTAAANGIRVWKADNVDLAKYKSLAIPRSVSRVPAATNDADRRQLDGLLNELQKHLSSELLSRSLVAAAIVLNTNAPAATAATTGSGSLVLDTEVVEYNKGATAGTGTTHIKGVLRDGRDSTPILRFTAIRPVDTNSVRELARDCAEAIVTTLKPPKGKNLR